jgi:hypothetical protein
MLETEVGVLPRLLDVGNGVPSCNAAGSHFTISHVFSPYVEDFGAGGMIITGCCPCPISLFDVRNPSI